MSPLTAPDEDGVEPDKPLGGASSGRVAKGPPQAAQPSADAKDEEEEEEDDDEDDDDEGRGAAQGKVGLVRTMAEELGLAVQARRAVRQLSGASLAAVPLDAIATAQPQLHFRVAATLRAFAMVNADALGGGRAVNETRRLSSFALGGRGEGEGDGEGKGEGEGDGLECAAASDKTERACPIEAVTGVASVPRSDDGDKGNGSNSFKARRR